MSSADVILVDRPHYFVADLHFGHTGILDMAMRPYADIGTHDRDHVTKWVSLVKPTDTVWHLGDFAGEDVPFVSSGAIL